MNDAALENWKRAAAEAAILEVRPGMLVGLGTGTTAAFAIEALGVRVREGLDCRAVATSERTAIHAARAGISLLALDEVAEIDLSIDGVDEIDPSLRAIKGAGGAMLREKIVAAATRRMIAIADASKAVPHLGAGPVPVEILALARASVIHHISMIGGSAVLREMDGKPVLTDQGNPILDCHFADLSDPAGCARTLSSIPGLLGHGLFLDEIDVLYLGSAQGVTCTERPQVAGIALA